MRYLSLTVDAYLSTILLYLITIERKMQKVEQSKILVSSEIHDEIF